MRVWALRVGAAAVGLAAGGGRRGQGAGGTRSSSCLAFLALLALLASLVHKYISTNTDAEGRDEVLKLLGFTEFTGFNGT
jgi:hypothetical protein